MARVTRPRLLRLRTFGVFVLLSAAALQVAAAKALAERLLMIEPASTWAGIARVHLEIEDLRQTGELLEGNYQIRIPLAPRRNDVGRIVLHSSATADQLGASLATVTGSAVSSTGQVHDVVAWMRPDGVVRIQVVTPDRILRFKSRYALL